MKKAVNRKRPAVNKIYYIYVGILLEVVSELKEIVVKAKGEEN